MLQKIRDKAHGWWVYLVVPVLILMFVLFGIGNYLTGGIGQTEVAKVNGDAISINNFAMLYQQINQQQNPHQDKQLAGYLKLQVLQNLVNQELFYQSLVDLGFTVSPNVIDGLIYHAPAFQVEGKFSMGKYQAILQTMGLQTEDLRKSLAKTYLVQQFQQGLMSSEFALPAEATHETMLANMVRDVSYVTIDPAMFVQDTSVSDADVVAYYQGHQSQFMTPYQLKLQYVTLSLDQFSRQFKDKNQAVAAFQNALTSLSNATFQNSTSLTPAATMLSVPVQSTGWLNVANATGLFSNPQVLAAAMSDGVLNGGNNSNVISIGKDQVMVLRVLDKKMPVPQGLQQVAPQIKAQLIKDQEMNIVGLLVKKMQASIAAGMPIAAVVANNHLSLQTAKGLNIASKNINKDLLSAFSQAPVGRSFVVSDQGRVVLFQVVQVYPGKLVVKIPPQAVAGLWSQVEVGSFLSHLQATATIKINDGLMKAN